MNIIVCVKRVPLTQEVDLEIDDTGKKIKEDALAYVINDWDNYAIEAAVQIQEALGGEVTAVTIGCEDDEEVLRRALAMGADRAIRIDSGDLAPDGYLNAKILAKAISELDYDLVLTGVQSEDQNTGMVGIMLAEQLGLAHAAVTNGFEPAEGTSKIRVELEGGIDEVSRIQLPALLTIQTGINEPRYVSIMGIRKAKKKELKVMSLEELGLTPDDLTPQTRIEEVFLPPETDGAEMIEGNPAEMAEAIIRIMGEKGVAV
ncbi:MAG: electron transfer flavoprotein subunit beta/FixA family protein [Deltaproteobacteria bacterium]|nr:electron transfer flavoprotein subunit beta/FixA family protein [Deltaproteobacteria bacterium]